MALALLVVSLSFFLSACNETAFQPANQPVLAHEEEHCQQLRLGVLLDKSKSTLKTRVQQPGVADFEALIVLVRKCGGELAVGLIRQDSNRSLLRLSLPQPPEPPQDTWLSITNRFQQAKARARDKRRKAAYRQSRLAWEEDTDRRVNDFKRELQSLLKIPVDAIRTDLWGGLRRIDLALAESEESSGPEIEKFGLLITDGIDDVGADPITSLRSKAQLLLINGSGSVGALQSLDPLRFESLDAALRFLNGRLRQKREPGSVQQ